MRHLSGATIESLPNHRPLVIAFGIWPLAIGAAVALGEQQALVGVLWPVAFLIGLSQYASP
jgi:hypothetical protein